MAEELKRLNDVAGKLNAKNPVFAKKPKKLENCDKCSYRYLCKPKEFAEELYR